MALCVKCRIWFSYFGFNLDYFILICMRLISEAAEANILEFSELWEKNESEWKKSNDLKGMPLDVLILCFFGREIGSKTHTDFTFKWQMTNRIWYSDSKKKNKFVQMTRQRNLFSFTEQNSTIQQFHHIDSSSIWFWFVFNGENIYFSQSLFILSFFHLLKTIENDFKLKVGSEYAMPGPEIEISFVNS